MIIKGQNPIAGYKCGLKKMTKNENNYLPLCWIVIQMQTDTVV